MELRSLFPLMLVLVGVCSFYRVSAFGYNYHSMTLAQPRCTAASKPCRIRAVLEEESGSQQVITSHPCSCPEANPCSDDWQVSADHVIVRELNTDGNINMTLSLMFCEVVQPQRVCNPGEIALRLTGYTHVLTEVDYITCTCADARPLVLHQKWTGNDFRVYQTFVCFSDKRRCNMRRRSKDICMEIDNEAHVFTYPCKCPTGTACNLANPYNTVEMEYTCQRTRAVRSG